MPVSDMSGEDAAVERALISDRLDRLEQWEHQEAQHHAELALICAQTRDGVAELVAIGNRREAREVEELSILAARRRASEEAEIRRADAEISARRETASWWRQQSTPLIAAGVGIMSALAAGISTWAIGGGP